MDEEARIGVEEDAMAIDVVDVLVCIGFEEFGVATEVVDNCAGEDKKATKRRVCTWTKRLVSV